MFTSRPSDANFQFERFSARQLSVSDSMPGLHHQRVTHVSREHLSADPTHSVPARLLDIPDGAHAGHCMFEFIFYHARSFHYQFAQKAQSRSRKAANVRSLRFGSVRFGFRNSHRLDRCNQRFNKILNLLFSKKSNQSSTGYTNYAIPFWCADILLVFVIVFLTFVDVTVEKPDGRFWRNVQQLARFIDVDIFMSMSLLLGTCWGFLETYLFIFLAQMKAPAYLLGKRSSYTTRLMTHHNILFSRANCCTWITDLHSIFLHFQSNHHTNGQNRIPLNGFLHLLPTIFRLFVHSVRSLCSPVERLLI